MSEKDRIATKAYENLPSQFKDSKEWHKMVQHSSNSMKRLLEEWLKLAASHASRVLVIEHPGFQFLLTTRTSRKMALVAYSDSEDSDIDAAKHGPTLSKLALSKGEGRKIKIELPAIRPEPGQVEDGGRQPPTKRAKTAGSFGGLNSLLPPPKRATAQASGLKKGTSLKTSSEVAFSRAIPVTGSAQERVDADDGYDEFGNQNATMDGLPLVEKALKEAPEMKITGNATRFKPLSVANKKKSVKKAKLAMANDSTTTVDRGESKILMDGPHTEGTPSVSAIKTKRSLFSFQQPEEDLQAKTSLDSFEPVTESVINKTVEPPATTVTTASAAPAAANSLEAVASDLNLTPAQRRQLFGRHKKDVNITHFNMDSEYAANEQLRMSGETMEHKAVKTIAPGKHSLQQLVNNARSNQESIEDKWAEGRRNRGESGSKYGWSR